MVFLFYEIVFGFCCIVMIVESLILIPIILKLLSSKCVI